MGKPEVHSTPVMGKAHVTQASASMNAANTCSGVAAMSCVAWYLVGAVSKNSSPTFSQGNVIPDSCRARVLLAARGR